MVLTHRIKLHVPSASARIPQLPEQDEGVERSVFQLAENVEQSPIDNPVAQEQSPTENEPKFTPEMGHEKILRKESAYVKQMEGRELLSLPPVYFFGNPDPGGVPQRRRVRYRPTVDA